MEKYLENELVRKAHDFAKTANEGTGSLTKRSLNLNNSNIITEKEGRKALILRKTQKRK